MRTMARWTLASMFVAGGALAADPPAKEPPEKPAESLRDEAQPVRTTGDTERAEPKEVEPALRDETRAAGKTAERRLERRRRVRDAREIRERVRPESPDLPF